VFEKENNSILARSILETKETNEGLKKKFEDLESRIKSVAPFLE
jgi:hypothetical protein